MKARDIVTDEYGNTFVVINPNMEVTAGEGRVVLVESVVTKERFEAPAWELTVDPGREVR